MLARGFARAFRTAFSASLPMVWAAVSCGVPDAEFEGPDASVSGTQPEGLGGYTSGSSAAGSAVSGSSAAGSSVSGSSVSGSSARESGAVGVVVPGGGGSSAVGGAGGVGARAVVQQCQSSLDCASNGALRTCDPVAGRCVECLPGTDSCGAGLYCNEKRECAVGCSADRGCPTGICDLTTHSCQRCSIDQDCSTGTRCDGESSICVAACRVAEDCPSGWECCDGACYHLALDEQSCGACGRICDQANAVFACLEGQCLIEKCNDGWGDCATEVSGCETDLKSTPVHCGRCDLACSGDLVCVEGRCAVGTCTAPFQDCDGKPSNGCEANLSADINHCGDCGLACDATQGVPSCQKGVCAIACNTGWGDCDANAANGCESDLSATGDNCGHCGGACSNANGSTRCLQGECLPTCGQGFGDCDGNPRNGCEANLQADRASCGACGATCSLSHAEAVCSAGACAIASCEAGWLDCDGNPVNGCEVDPASSPSHCAQCGQTCSSNNGTAICSRGICSTQCAAGFADCNQNAGDGCEVELGRSVLHCGVCGNACSDVGGVPSCRAGICAIDNCSDPFGNCDGNAANGCEADTDRDPNNCGACGNVCHAANGTASCQGGVCGVTGCLPDYSDCDGKYETGCETHLKTNDNCGACRQECAPLNAASASCATGICQVAACAEPYANCDGDHGNGCERNTHTDAGHCGACDGACSSNHGTPACMGGVCAISCSSGFGDCDGSVSNGCEQSLADSSHCGACTNVCSSVRGTPACISGACAIDCTPGYGNCNGDARDGCENQLTSAVHCGTCGNTCAVSSGTGQCIPLDGLGYSCQVGACAPFFANCDGQYGNGCETDTRDSLAHCGACQAPCAFSNGTGRCAAGLCSLAECQTNFGNCDGQIRNGCETNLLTTSAHCSSCSNTCADDFPHAAGVCSGGACSPGPCLPGYGNCDGNTGNGCEANLVSDVANCGSCGLSCSAPRATGTCLEGVCRIAVCEPDWADCNGNTIDGCEVNTASSVRHCGECGNACSSDGGTPSCTGGQCQISSCASPYGNCDGNARNGCETNLSTSLANCGECGYSCQASNAVTSCNAGKCGITQCQAGYADCNGRYEDGCEVNTATNVSHCGGCALACSAAHGGPSCLASQCAIACEAGYGNCDGSVVNGCETNTQTSLQHCSACGKPCTLPNAVTRCSGGSCQLDSCLTGFADCDGNPANGCEIDISSSPSNCGACHQACSYANGNGVCSRGVCSLGDCAAGYANCDGDVRNGCEVNTNSSVDNCRTCGHSCAAANSTARCSNATCVLSGCNAGYGDCDQRPDTGCETPLLTDPTHCGVCAESCLGDFAHAGAICAAGACAPGACDAGWGDCNRGAQDGCEASLSTTSNCGTCGNSCLNAHGTTSCSVAGCTPACASGWGDCDSSRNNGCEQSLTLAASCGSCGRDCTGALPHATAKCAGSPLGCELDFCDYLWGNCDGNTANGCEKDLSTDLSNCGACGSACINAHGTTSCVLGGCAPVCSAAFGDCDSNTANGCEKDVSSDPNNCGGCNLKCGGTTPFCVDSVCSSHMKIELVNSATAGGKNGPDLAVDHVLATASKNRRLLLAAVGTVGNTDYVPLSVTYNGAVMKLAQAAFSGNQAWAGVYTLLDAALPANPGTYNLTVDTGRDCMNVVANLLEFRNVDQLQPIGATVGTPSIKCIASDTIAIGLDGSWAYDLAALFGKSTPGGASLGFAKTKTLQREQTNTNVLTGVGGFAGPLSAGAQLTGWTISGCNTTAHVVVEVRPAGS